jgi:TIR domain
MNDSTKPEYLEVFISYSQDSVAHMDHVLRLTNRLRADGVDALIDQYEVSPPEGWPRWMDTNIRNSKYVVLVCTERYLNRLMGEEKEGTGLGVRWEGHLIYQHIYNAGSLNTRFIPVVLYEGDKKFIPTPLQGSTYYCLATDAGYEDLYRRLVGQPKTEKPKLGKRRPLPQKPVNPAMYVTQPIDVDLWNAAQWKATLFATAPGEPPVLGIAFFNEEPARKIFEQWRKRYGVNDPLEELRVAIVEGPIKGERPGYSVHIGADHEAVIKRLKQSGYEVNEGDIHMFISRVHRMNPPPDSTNLERFKREVEQHKVYFFAPAIISRDLQSTRLLLELGIYKGKIHFRQSSEIGKNDIDAAVLPLPKDSTRS